MSSIAIIVFAVILMVIIGRSIHVCPDTDRLAVVTLGRFDGFRGPGLVFTTPNVQQVVALKAGDGGILITADSAQFGKIVIPVNSEGATNIQGRVKIIRFEGAQKESRTIVTKDVEQRREISCEKCGHKMEV